MRSANVDNDLVKIIGQLEEAGGEVMMLNGPVMNADGAPLADHRLEIWQCEGNGKPLYSDDTQAEEFDSAFRGFRP